MGANGTIIDSTFIKNTGGNGGAIDCSGANFKVTGCTFNSNTAKWSGGGVYINGDKGSVTDSTFTSNKADFGGGVYWNFANGSLTDSTFNNNTAGSRGGAIYYDNINSTLSRSIFINNNDYYGSAVYWNVNGHMINCSFVNSKWTKSNGIYAAKDLKINGGNGIINIFIQGTLSGISIIVLNNETYYYPPNSNINFIYSLENHKT